MYRKIIYHTYIATLSSCNSTTKYVSFAVCLTIDTFHHNTRITSATDASPHHKLLQYTSPHQKPVSTYTQSHTFYMPRSSHSFYFDHPNNFCLGIHIIKASNYVVFSTSLLSSLFSNNLSLYSFLNVRNQVSHPNKTKQNKKLVRASFIIFHSKL